MIRRFQNFLSFLILTIKRLQKCDTIILRLAAGLISGRIIECNTIFTRLSADLGTKASTVGATLVI
jgi:hypothetical protein